MSWLMDFFSSSSGLCSGKQPRGCTEMRTEHQTHMAELHAMLLDVERMRMRLRMAKRSFIQMYIDQGRSSEDYGRSLYYELATRHSYMDVIMDVVARKGA